MTIVTDPLFYLLAIPAVTLLGLGKGGFAGVGMISTPLLALALPPLQAAAILLPILIVQDAISVWVYRRDWDAWNLKVLLIGSVFGVAIAALFAAQVSDAHVRLLVGLIGVSFVLFAWFGRVAAQARRPSAASGMFWGALSGFTSMLALRSLGVPTELVIYPGQFHGLTVPSYQRDRLTRYVAWFDTYLKAAAKPAGSPRYSRSSSGSGRTASLSMWLVENPSMALATGISDSDEAR